MVRRVVSAGVIPGVVSGLIAGVLFLGGGSLMGIRLLRLITGTETYDGLGGTVGLMALSIALGSFGGFLFQIAAETKTLPRLFAGKGATFGFLLFVLVLPVAPHYLLMRSVHDHNTISLLISVFGLLFIGYGVLLDVLFREFRHKSVQTKIS